MNAQPAPDEGAQNQATDTNGDQSMLPTPENATTTGAVDIVVGEDPSADANATVLDLGLVDAAVSPDGDVAVHVNGDIGDLGLLDVAAKTDGGDAILVAGVDADLSGLGLLCDDQGGQTAQGEDVGITLALGADTPADFSLFGDDSPFGVTGLEPLSALDADPLSLTDAAPLNLAGLDLQSLELCPLVDHA
jgi:hypothetical protein